MTLRARLKRRPILIAPGVHDALTALIAEKAGAEALYLSGAALAYCRFGRPDLGLVSMAEMADHIAAVRDRVALPLIADADTGFGNALNVQRTVRVFERMGANAIQIEDQSLPKRCGHLAGKTLIGAGEMRGKIRAALDARASDETLIIARTDAIAVEGFASALDRAESYAEAGADMVFVEAMRDDAQMRAAVARLGARAPLMVNMVEGGRTPPKDAAALEGLGFAMVIFPGAIVRAAAKMAEDFYASLLARGATDAFRERMHDFDGLNRLIGTPEAIALGKRFEEG